MKAKTKNNLSLGLKLTAAGLSTATAIKTLTNETASDAEKALATTIVCLGVGAGFEAISYHSVKKELLERQEAEAHMVLATTQSINGLLGAFGVQQ